MKVTCFLPVELIAEVTMFCERKGRYTLDNLLAKGYITKSRIEGRKLYQGKRRNKFENCRYHLVPEVWGRIESPFRKHDESDDAALTKSQASAGPVPIAGPSRVAAQAVQ